MRLLMRLENEKKSCVKLVTLIILRYLQQAFLNLIMSFAKYGLYFKRVPTKMLLVVSVISDTVILRQYNVGGVLELINQIIVTRTTSSQFFYTLIDLWHPWVEIHAVHVQQKVVWGVRF